MIYHLSLWRKYCFFVLSLWLVLPIIVGAEPHTEYQIEAFRTFESIEIDGQFNEPDWQNAKPIGQFVQVEPEEGAPMTLPTELRVLYDNQNIYFGFTCFDKEIDKLVANDMRRDARALTRNDTVFVLLDTYKMLLANLNQAAKAENRGVLVCEGIFFISQSIAHVRRSRCDVKVMETETFRSVISKVAYFSVYPFLTVICLLAVNFDEKW